MVNDRDPSCAVRVFDLNTGDNYVLVPPARRKSQGLPKSAESAAADPTGRRLSCLCYDADAKTLACGQRDGRVVMFRPPRPGRAGARRGGREAPPEDDEERRRRMRGGCARASTPAERSSACTSRRVAGPGCSSRCAATARTVRAGQAER